jgi:hypothetical protein
VTHLTGGITTVDFARSDSAKESQSTKKRTRDELLSYVGVIELVLVLRRRWEHDDRGRGKSLKLEAKIIPIKGLKSEDEGLRCRTVGIVKLAGTGATRCYPPQTA